MPDPIPAAQSARQNPIPNLATRAKDLPRLQKLAEKRASHTPKQPVGPPHVGADPLPETKRLAALLLPLEPLMSLTLLSCLAPRARRFAAPALTGSLLLLALLLPASAIPAAREASVLRNVVYAAGPRLPRLPHHGDGYWHTDRNRILDDGNREIRIGGVNWSGFETRRGVPGGLLMQDYRDILRTVKQQGYNTIRLPLSNEMIERPHIPQEIRYSSDDDEPINADLQGLDSMQILDRIVAAAGKLGLRVILDDHRSEAGDSAEASGLWYTPDYPEAAWIADWTDLARRYKDNSTVIGMDLRNEPHNAATGGACWDCGGDHDWHLAAERAGNAVLRVNPKLLIFVEGVDSYEGDSYWWGGNLEGVRRSPVRLAIPNRLVYSAHTYGPVEYQQPWFNQATTRATLRAVWRRHWAYISESGLAPVWIGEFGTPNSDADIRSQEPGSEGQWFSELVQFLGEEHSIQWTYWGINGEDRYGLLDPKYRSFPANASKAQALAMLLPGHLDLAHPSPAQAPANAVEQPPAAIMPSTNFVPTSTYAEAARANVQQLFPAPVVNDGPATPARPAMPDPETTKTLRSGPTESGSRAEVNRAVADDVQRAIAAAMEADPSHANK